MMRLRRGIVWVYGVFVCLYPDEFRRRYSGEMRMDFADLIESCTSVHDVLLTASGEYLDLLTNARRQWQRCDLVKTMVLAFAIHTVIWLTVVAVSAWQWSGGPDVLPAVVLLTLATVPGLAVSVGLQRRSEKPVRLNTWNREAS